MDDMLTKSATSVRNNFSATIDEAVRERPVFFKRARDTVFFMGEESMKDLLINVYFDAQRFTEEDGSVTVSLVDMDIVANGRDEPEAKERLAADIKEYADDYYRHYKRWSMAPNRKNHIPYVIKALMLSLGEIGELIRCRTGKN